MRLAASFALTTLCACAGAYTNGDSSVNPPDAGGIGLVDAGDQDAGGDAGVDAGPDAGCVAANLTGLLAVDSCPGPQSQSATASVTVSDAAHGCAVSISLTTSTVACTGVASHGTLNAFDGTCQGLPGYTCTAASLPGTLHCTYVGSCPIQICSGSTCP